MIKKEVKIERGEGKGELRDNKFLIRKDPEEPDAALTLYMGALPNRFKYDSEGRLVTSSMNFEKGKWSNYKPFDASSLPKAYKNALEDVGINPDELPNHLTPYLPRKKAKKKAEEAVEERAALQPAA